MTAITHTTSHRAEAPGIVIRAFNVEDKKLPDLVEVTFKLHTVFSVPPEILERAGELMRDLRYEIASDYRAVCAEHGYHEIGDCPKCLDEKVAVLAPPEAA